MLRLKVSPLDSLLVCVPAAVVLDWLAPARSVPIFILACAGLLPLAAWIGRATERLAERVGEGLGGLLTATFGNAAELIVGIAALRHGLMPLVKATITGAIVGNILLVLGGAILAGGMRFKVQRFNETGARAQATMLTLAAVALVAPSFFHRTAGAERAGTEANLALAIAVVLLVTYACGLVFALRTHRRLFRGSGWNEAEAGRAAALRASGAGGGRSAVWLGILAAATGAAAVLSEVLVRAVEPAARALGLNQVFIGVVVLAIAANAAEHMAAIQVARHDRMDLTFGIALGSSVQVALFVAPLFVVLSRWLGPRPMDFAFSMPEVVAVAAAVVVAGQVAGDGETNWLEGVQLLAVYAILAAVFYFLPGGG